MWARPGADGPSTTAFPSGVGSVSVETAEVAAPVIYHATEFICSSGGAGRFRGSLGQRIEISARIGEDMSMSAADFERLRWGPQGRQGGQRGADGKVAISDGTQITDKGMYTVPSGEPVIVQTPGGGGFGNPAQRDSKAARQDLSDGSISKGAARTLGVFTKN